MDGLIWDHPDKNGEFDWLAIDQINNIAIISTAGIGPVPLQSTQDREFLLGVYNQILDLPIIGEAVFIRDHGLCADWADASDRGFFCYDWDYDRELYEIISVPTNTLKAEDIFYSELYKYAKRVALSLIFKETKEIKTNIQIKKNSVA